MPRSPDSSSEASAKGDSRDPYAADISRYRDVRARHLAFEAGKGPSPSREEYEWVVKNRSRLLDIKKGRAPMDGGEAGHAGLERQLAAVREALGGAAAWAAVESPSSRGLGLDALLDPAEFARLSALTPAEVTAELDRIPYVALNFPAATSDADKARGVVRHRPNWWSDVPDLEVGGVPVAPTWGLAFLRSIAAHQDSFAGATLLLDSAPKPKYIDGSQHYGSAAGTDASLDPLLPLFREAFGPTASRFSHTHDQLVSTLLPLAREKVRAVLAAKGLPTDNVEVILAPFQSDQRFMSETSPESSSTDMSEWTSTPLVDQNGAGAGRFLLAGGSGRGGAGYVVGCHPSVGFGFVGARLAVVFRP